MKGILRMSGKERDRLRILELVKQKYLSLKQASLRIGISYRQMKRIYKRFKEEGEKGLIHRSRGQASSRKTTEKTKRDIVNTYKETYVGFGPTLAVEKLNKEGYKISKESLRQWLIEEGLWQRKRRRAEHRQRRERKKHFGDMVQLDGSHHEWFGKGYGKSCLMNMVDDATGTTLSIMREEETKEAAMRVLWSWIIRYGIPLSIYCDRKNVYVTDREPTIEEQLEGKEPMTAFGRACEKLGIEIITAYSPQAKGRVERSHGVYQDRFVKELKLLEIRTIEGANKVLCGGFIDDLNKRFAKEALNPEDFHVPAGNAVDLRTVFCYGYKKVVSNDWVVRHNNRHYQIMKENKIIPKQRTKVLLQEWLDGTIHIYFENKELHIKEIVPTMYAKDKIAC